jgi:hypothetical protein
VTRRGWRGHHKGHGAHHARKGRGHRGQPAPRGLHELEQALPQARRHDAHHRRVQTGARKDIESRGYTIIANIGDQYSDRAGGHAARAFKLANPFYFLP